MVFLCGSAHFLLRGLCNGEQTGQQNSDDDNINEEHLKSLQPNVNFIFWHVN